MNKMEWKKASFSYLWNKRNQSKASNDNFNNYHDNDNHDNYDHNGLGITRPVTVVLTVTVLIPKTEEKIKSWTFCKLKMFELEDFDEIW